jgi:VWFA-related protein
MLPLLAVIAVLSLQAQQQQAEQTPSIRVTTRAVQISAVVTDGKGKPVPGLTIDDFTLLDKGKPQRLAAVNQETRTAEPPPKLEPGLFTNYWALSPTNITPASTVILIDTLNTSFADQAYARDQVLRFLEGIQPQDRVALYWLGTQLRVIHEFSSDTAALVRTVQRLKANPSREIAGSTDATDFSAMEGDPMLAEMLQAMKNSEENMRDFYMAERIRRTLLAMEQIGRHIARLPGRKNLVWVSGSFPLHIGLDEGGEQWRANPTRNRRSFTDEVSRTTRLFNDSNIAIYPVDARGLLSSPLYSAVTPSRALIRVPGQAAGRPSDDPMRAIYNSHDTMSVLASATGGRAFFNSNDITGAIRNAIDETSITYLITYYPDHEEWNGQWRKVQLKLANRNGLRIRHRNGYAALGDDPTPKALEALRKQALAEVIGSALDATELVIASYFTRFSDSQVDLTLRIYPNSITLASHDGKWNGGVEVFYVLTGGPEQQKSTYFSTQLNIALDAAQLERFRTEGILMRRRITVAKDRERLKVVVRDKASGRMGSLALPLHGLPPTPPDEKPAGQ